MKHFLTLSILTLIVGCSSDSKDRIKTMPEECKTLEVSKSFSRWEDKNQEKRKPPILPAKIIKDQMEGCALLSFDFDKMGKAKNVKVLNEFPPRYDIGKAFALYLLSNQFQESAGKSKQASVFIIDLK